MTYTCRAGRCSGSSPTTPRRSSPAGREAPGHVEVGGVDLAALDPAVARATVVVAPHEATLLSGTIRDNVPGDWPRRPYARPPPAT